MKINKYCSFRLEPNVEQERLLNQTIGCARLIYNKILAMSYEMFAQDQYIRYETLAPHITQIKKLPEFAFLYESHSTTLQQKIRDLALGWKKYFDPKEHARLKENKTKPKKPKFFKLANGTQLQIRPLMPKFKRKSDNQQSFRIPFKGNCVVEGKRVLLPKGIGWVKFRKSMQIEGEISSVTIKKIAGHWYVSFCTEQEIFDSVIHPSKTDIGLDMGIKKLIATSNDSYIVPKNSFKHNQVKLAKLQRKQARKIKFSENWKNLNRKIQKLHHHIANIRKDYLHKISTEISKNHAMIVVEDLKVANMSKSASGTLEQKGKKVKAKSGLNKAILDQGWSMMIDMLKYKQQWRGGLLVKVNPQYTSQSCCKCGHVAKENRRTQARFKCVNCSYVANADFNAARNILAAGHVVLSVEGGCGKGRLLKQKASETARISPKS